MITRSCDPVRPVLTAVAEPKRSHLSFDLTTNRGGAFARPVPVLPLDIALMCHGSTSQRLESRGNPGRFS